MTLQEPYDLMMSLSVSSSTMRHANHLSRRDVGKKHVSFYNQKESLLDDRRTSGGQPYRCRFGGKAVGKKLYF